MNKRPLHVRRGYLTCIGLMLAVVIVWSSGWLDDTQWLNWLAGQQVNARTYAQEHLPTSIAIAMLVYVLVTASGFPGSTALSIVSATILPFWASLLAVSFSSTIGATLAMLMSRYLLRDMVHSWFGDRFETFEQARQRDGLWYLASMRLAPYVPFFSINLLMGLTPVKTRSFFLVSQIAMFPGTVVNLNLGSRLPPLRELLDSGIPSILTWELTLAFTLLAITPLMIRYFIKRK